MPHQLLDREMFVQRDRLRAGQGSEIGVEVPPTGLNHPQVRGGDEMGDGLLEKFGLRDEIGVKDRYILPGGTRQAALQCPGLVPLSPAPVDQVDIHPP